MSAVIPATLGVELPTRMVIPGIMALSRAERPELPFPNDGNPWVTGRCWLYCGRDEVSVMWIGPVTVAAASAPMFACAECIARLNSLVWEHLLWKDTGEATVHPTLPAALPVSLLADLAPTRPDSSPAVPRCISEVSTGRRHRRPKVSTVLLRGAVGTLSRLRHRSGP
ncbi:hypothetical protein [Kitasatospora sp. NPDC057223]|uniref:hypothetical protein n=1 Tax=Kitasatospora sp. NPDC057223 TaxID=3346055 RepID=UPI00363794AC